MHHAKPSPLDPTHNKKSQAQTHEVKAQVHARNTKAHSNKAPPMQDQALYQVIQGQAYYQVMQGQSRYQVKPGKGHHHDKQNQVDSCTFKTQVQQTLAHEQGIQAQTFKGKVQSHVGHTHAKMSKSPPKWAQVLHQTKQAKVHCYIKKGKAKKMIDSAQIEIMGKHSSDSMIDCKI